MGQLNSLCSQGQTTPGFGLHTPSMNETAQAQVQAFSGTPPSLSSTHPPAVPLTSLQCTSASVNSSGTKGLPDNGLTDVGGNKEGNTRPQAVTFLEQLI